MDRKFIAVAFSFAVLAASAAAQTNVTNSNDGTSGTVPVYSGAASVTNSPISVSGSNVGIGITNPSFRLQIAGTPSVSNAIAEIQDTSATGSNTTFGGLYLGSSPGTDFVLGKKSVSTTTYFQIRTHTGTELLTLDAFGNLGIGTTNPLKKLHIAGDVEIDGSLYFGSNTTAQSAAYSGSCGADYAEAVDVTGDRTKYEAGDVLVIDPKAPGKFLKSNEAYSTMAAGIYSTKPGFVGRLREANDPASKDEIPMAMLGRVPTKVTAESGPIQVGDLLVTSSTVGYAMKGTDRGRLTGAVIGKALGSLDSGTGTIMVLVTLQ